MAGQDTIRASRRDIVADLKAAGDEVDAMLAGLNEQQWQTPTPAPGWTIADQVAHLAATFQLAGLAAADPEAFQALAGRLSPDFDANVKMAMSRYLGDPPVELMRRWQHERTFAEEALAAVPGDRIVPWLVRPLPAAVLTAAGMMELFGHGQDIADALGVRREPTDRIQHLVAFAVRTWDFGYQARGLPTPEIELRFELTAPSGAVWEYGPEQSDQLIKGSAADFCLLVSRRRHPADLDLRATGDQAGHWLTVAQAYRGPAGTGRTPGQFAASN